MCVLKNDTQVKQLLFSLAYVWLRVGVHIMSISSGSHGIRHWNEQSSFLLKFVCHFLSRQNSEILKSLDPQEFLLCMYVVGLHRRLPGTNYYNYNSIQRNNSVIFPKELENKALSIYQHILISEVGLLSRSLAMANLEPQVELSNKLFNTLLKMEDSDISRVNHSLKSILQVLSKSEINRELGTKVMLKYTPFVDDLSLHTKIRLGLFVKRHCSNVCESFVEPYILSLM